MLPGDHRVLVRLKPQVPFPFAGNQRLPRGLRPVARQERGSHSASGPVPCPGVGLRWQNRCSTAHRRTAHARPLFRAASRNTCTALSTELLSCGLNWGSLAQRS